MKRTNINSSSSCSRVNSNSRISRRWLIFNKRIHLRRRQTRLVSGSGGLKLPNQTRLMPQLWSLSLQGETLKNKKKRSKKKLKSYKKRVKRLRIRMKIKRWERVKARNRWKLLSRHLRSQDRLISQDLKEEVACNQNRQTSSLKCLSNNNNHQKNSWLIRK